MASVDQLLSALGLPGAPLVRRGVGETIRFFETVVREDPIKWANEGYLGGIDFHKDVAIEPLPPGTMLSRHDPPDSKLKPFAYFTKPGTSPFSTGTSFPTSEFRLYRTVTVTPALVSRAAGLRFGVTNRVDRLGGGIQYIIAFADLPRLERVAESRSR